MLTTVALAVAIATSGMTETADAPFKDPLLEKMAATCRANIAQFSDAIAEQSNFRASILRECGGRPPNATQQAGIDQATKLIGKYTESIQFCEETLAALARHKKGVPLAEAGFPKASGK